MRSAIIKGEDAKNLMNNKLLQEAFAAVAEHLEAQALSCDPDNKDKASRIVIAKQLLAGIKREIARVIDDGYVAKVQLEEIEKRSMLKTVFRR